MHGASVGVFSVDKGLLWEPRLEVAGVLLPGLDFTGPKEPFDFRHSYTYRSVSQTWRPPSIIRILRHAAC